MDQDQYESLMKMNTDLFAENVRLRSLATNYRSILLKIVNDPDLKFEDPRGLLYEARHILGQEE